MNHKERAILEKKITERRYAEERKHRIAERRYWKNQTIYNVVVGCLTIVAAGAAIWAAAAVSSLENLKHDPVGQGQECYRISSAAVEANRAQIEAYQS
jgi:hypothetical protein